MFRHFLLSLVSLALVGQVALGANKTTTTARRSTASTTTSSTQETVSGTSGNSDVYLSLGFGLPIFPQNGETGFGTNFGVLTRVEQGSRLLVGADLGLHFWGHLTSSDSTTGLQVLPTAVYELSASRTLVPYIGLSAGPYLFFSPSTTVEFALLFRPGLTWNATRTLSLNVEAKFGQLSNAFIVLPVTSLSIQL